METLEERPVRIILREMYHVIKIPSPIDVVASVELTHFWVKVRFITLQPYLSCSMYVEVVWWSRINRKTRSQNARLESSKNSIYKDKRSLFSEICSTFQKNSVTIPKLKSKPFTQTEEQGNHSIQFRLFQRQQYKTKKLDIYKFLRIEDSIKR